MKMLLLMFVPSIFAVTGKNSSDLNENESPDLQAFSHEKNQEGIKPFLFTHSSSKRRNVGYPSAHPGKISLILFFFSFLEDFKGNHNDLFRLFVFYFNISFRFGLKETQSFL